ncbi:MAG TPA: hypothetical protein VLF63_02530 [Patescibacteria group bacterium]|nr:hypothetical protein [Patescibacteria group bacterium]
MDDQFIRPNIRSAGQTDTENKQTPPSETNYNKPIVSKPKKSKFKTFLKLILLLILLAGAGYGGYKFEHGRALKVENNQQVEISTLEKNVKNLQNQSTQKSSSKYDLAIATNQSQYIYDQYNIKVLKGQTLQDKSVWATKNVTAAQDLQFINANKSWFSTKFVSAANNYETTNTVPKGGAILICAGGLPNFNEDIKAESKDINEQSATVNINYTTGSKSTSNLKNYSLPVTLISQDNNWIIDSIDLSSCPALN